MFNSINFNLLRVDEYHTLGNRIEEVVSKMVKEDPQLQGLAKNLQRDLKHLDQAHLKPTTKYLTLSVEEADDKRDNSFRALRSYLEACSRRLQKGWPEAANLILEVLNQHGYTLYKESYDKQTSRMNNLIGEINSKAELKAAAETINLLPWLEEMTNANQEFETLYSKRNQANANTAEVKTEEACKAIRQDIHLLFKYIEVMISLNLHPEYSEMVKQINGYTAQVMANVRSRRTRYENLRQQAAQTGEN